MTPEQRRAGGLRAAAVNKKAARSRAGVRFPNRRAAYLAGFQAGYRARIRYEQRQDMATPQQVA